MISCDRENGMSDETKDFGTEIVEPYLKVLGEKNNQLSYDGGRENIWIESNTEWTCAIDGHKDLNLQIDKSKGYGDDVIVVTYENTRNKHYSYNLIGTLTIRWTNSSGYKSYETITFYRHYNPF